MFKMYFECEFFQLLLRSDGLVLESVEFVGFGGENKPCKLLERACEELALYFAGRLCKFQLPLAKCGTAFERKVYQALSEIPYGQVMSYAQVARKIGSLNAARAVGNANAKNPLPIFVPCHRVISANGLGGYSGGVGLFESLQDDKNENKNATFGSNLTKNLKLGKNLAINSTFAKNLTKNSNSSENFAINANSKRKFTSPLDIKRYLLGLEGVDLSRIEG